MVLRTLYKRFIINLPINSNTINELYLYPPANAVKNISCCIPFSRERFSKENSLETLLNENKLTTYKVLKLKYYYKSGCYRTNSPLAFSKSQEYIC